MKRKHSAAVLGATLLALVAAALPDGAARATSTIVKPVIGAPMIVPATPAAGRRLTVAFPVRRSDTGRPLQSGRMICDPSVAGKVIQHVESFKAGTAKLSFVVPKSAAGKVLRVKVTIRLGTAAATRIASFAVPKAAAAARLSIADASVVEGNSGMTTLSFPVTLSAASRSAVVVTYATADGTATAGSDFTAATGTLTFKPGETSKAIAVSVIGDTTVEQDEMFGVTLENASGATIAVGTATGTIKNDDVAPPTPRIGHYAGTYTDGTYFNFDVGSSGRSIGNFAFDFNGHCPGYGTSYGRTTIPGFMVLPVGGVFSATAKTSSGDLAVALGGTVSSDGSASGSLRVDMYFSDGVTCTSSGTWSAHVQ